MLTSNKVGDSTSMGHFWHMNCNISYYTLLLSNKVVSAAHCICVLLSPELAKQESTAGKAEAYAGIGAKPAK